MRSYTQSALARRCPRAVGERRSARFVQGDAERLPAGARRAGKDARNAGMSPEEAEMAAFEENAQRRGATRWAATSMRGDLSWVNRPVLGIPARAAARPRAAGAHPRLERVPPATRRRDAAQAGRALHGLRRSLLPHRHVSSGMAVGLPDQQPHPRVERPGLSRPVEGGPRPPAQDQQLPRVHRPRLPRAVRRLLRAGHQRAGRHHQEHRVRHRRPRLRGRLGRARAAARRAPARRSPSSAPGPPAWPPPRSSTRPGTRSPSSSAPTASAACSCTASPT